MFAFIYTQVVWTILAQGAPLRSAMELASTELDRTTHATLPFPEKVRSGSTSHSVTSHSRDNKASFFIALVLEKYQL